MNKIVSVGISLAVIVFAVILASNSVNNLQKIESEKEASKPIFQDNIRLAIELCENSNIDTTFCQQNLKDITDMCSFYGNPPACSDPRITMILSGNFEQFKEFNQSYESEVVSYRYEKPLNEMSNSERELSHLTARLVRDCIRFATENYEITKQFKEGQIEWSSQIEDSNISVARCDSDIANLERDCDVNGICSRDGIEKYYDAREGK